MPDKEPSNTVKTYFDIYFCGGYKNLSLENWKKISKKPEFKIKKFKGAYSNIKICFGYLVLNYTWVKRSKDDDFTTENETIIESDVTDCEDKE